MKKEIVIYEGKVKRDVFGSWDDCSLGLYLDTDKIETIFNQYKDSKIKVTIERIEEILEC